MNRLLPFFTAAIVSALLIGLAGFAAPNLASAQPGVCISLPPGEHSISAPARDREGDVIFRLTVAEGGQVTEFIEPGGQSIPPAAMVDIFTGDDAYPLPEGVALIECGQPASDSSTPAADSVCLDLEPGAYTEDISAGGRTYAVTVNVSANGVIDGVEIRGQTYSAAEGLQLLEGFGASLPASWVEIDCPGAHYPTTGSGGLADSSPTPALWAVFAAIAALALFGAGLALRRRSA